MNTRHEPQQHNSSFSVPQNQLWRSSAGVIIQHLVFDDGGEEHCLIFDDHEDDHSKTGSFKNIGSQSASGLMGIRRYTETSLCNYSVRK